MADSIVLSLIETVEGRTLFSWTPVPVFGQFPPPIVAKVFPQPEKPAAPSQPSAVSEPVQPVLASAPAGLKARPWFKAAAIGLSWTSVDPSAQTIVIEASTDGGQSFTTIAMLDADQRKFGAKHLDRHKSYTFRMFTLDGQGAASPVADLPVSWVCKKK